MLFQTAWAQNKCDFHIEVIEITGSDCEKNGTIKVHLEGPDIANMPNKQYRAYLEGELPPEKWSPDSLLGGLLPGTYIVEAKAHCTVQGVDVEETITNVVVPKVGVFVDTNVQVYTTYNRASFSCTPNGRIALYHFEYNPRGPYKLEFTTVPDAYTGDKVLYYSETTPPVTSFSSVYYINNLPPGQYVVKFTDGCGTGGWTDPFTIGTQADIYSGFYSYTYIGASPADKNKVRFRTYSRPTSYDHLNFNQIYEYAVFHEIDGGEASIQESDWVAYPSSTSATYINYVSPYTIKEMREDATKRPKLKIRLKDPACDGVTKVFTLSHPTPSLYRDNYDITMGCGVVRRGYYANSGYSTLISYPYTWTITQRNYNNTADSIVIAQSETPVVTPGTYHYYNYEPGYYRFDVVDAEDHSLTSGNFTIAAPTNNIILNYYSPSYSACTSAYVSAPYFYLNSYGGTLKKAHIKFDEAASSLSPGAPLPLKTDTILPVGYTSGSYYPFGSSVLYYANGYTPLDKYVFQVTDSCETTTKTITYTVPDYYTSTFRVDDLNTIKDELFDIVPVECERVRIYPKNMNTVITNTRKSDGVVVSPTTYINYVSGSGPKDVTVTGSSSWYWYSNTVPGSYMEVNKSGSYTFQIQEYSSYTNCYKTVTIDVESDYMRLDEDASAAYRCPGSNRGSGYISVSTKNGSGNYDYYLFNMDDKVNAIDSSKNVTVGVFTNWAVKADKDNLLVRVIDHGCNRQFEQEIYVYDLDNPTLARVDGGPRRCLGEPIQFIAVPLGETDYEWTGPNNWSSTERNPIIPVASLESSGTYTVKIKILGCSEAFVTRDLFVSVADTRMYWNPDAQNNSWHDTNNWLIMNSGGGLEQAKAVPAPCTTVHIGGLADNFPNLDKAYTPRSVGEMQYGLPACDTIIYHYGSQTAYPHYLRYNKAKVQYDFGFYLDLTEDQQPEFNYDQFTYPKYTESTILPRIDRARWYLISAPLKKMTGGDFGVAGRPAMYQRLYNAVEPQRFYASHDSYTLSFHTLDQDLSSTGNALALWASDYDTSYGETSNHSHLEDLLMGVMEFPYFKNPTALEAHHHKYDAATSTSSFGYYNKEAPYQLYYDKWANYQRGEEAYRFVFENAQDTVDLAVDLDGVQVAVYNMKLPPLLGGSSSRRLMVGNPFMCHLDFDKVMAYNVGVIEDNYWHADPQDETFVAYRTGSEAVHDPSITKDIAPLQGFVVQVAANPIRDYLILPMEGNYSVMTGGGTPLPSPRSTTDDTPKGWITVDGITPPKTGIYATSDSVRVRSSVMFNYDLRNIPKLIVGDSDSDMKAETFFVDSDDYLNTEQIENTKPSEVYFGIESTYKGDIALRVNTGGNLLKTVTLIDTRTGSQVNMDNGGYYKFKQSSGLSKGVDAKRFKFVLTYESSEVGIGDGAETALSVSLTNDNLYVYSSEMIEEVQLIDIVGKSVVSAGQIKSNEYRRGVSLPTGSYITKVKLSSGRVETRKIVLQ